MDIQFSGAVDFSPLFNRMNTFQARGPFPQGAPDFQGNLFQNQNAILQPLNQQNNLPIGQAAEESTFSILA